MTSWGTCSSPVPAQTHRGPSALKNPLRRAESASTLTLPPRPPRAPGPSVDTCHVPGRVPVKRNFQVSSPA